MQTFVPTDIFSDCAAVLDRQRLGKQRVETLQTLQALSGLTRGWVNHPAVRMWRNHEWALLAYGLTVCSEWTQRGYRDTCASKMLHLADTHGQRWGTGEPAWMGDERVHASHRSNLLRKHPEHYRPLWPSEPDDLPYYWPVNP